jgi:sugar phosphate isomerase/epimerase
MARKVTLFTGQWADLPLAELCKMAKGFGYEGLELACWGDHMDLDVASKSKGYCEDKRGLLKENGLECFAISNHLSGQLVSDNIDERHYIFAPKALKGDPKAAKKWAIEMQKKAAKAAKNMGHQGRERFYGFTDLAPALLLPSLHAGTGCQWI